MNAQLSVSSVPAKPPSGKPFVVSLALSNARPLVNIQVDLGVSPSNPADAKGLGPRSFMTAGNGWFECDFDLTFGSPGSYVLMASATDPGDPSDIIVPVCFKVTVT